SRALGRLETFPIGDLAMDEACRRFSPDVILYRPVADHLYLHDAALRLIDSLGKPYALWLMDDWPERLRNTNPAAHERIDEDLRRLFACSYANFAISDSMADTFRERYGVEFDVVRNGVRKIDWPQRRSEKQQARSPIRLRYSGNLAPDMTRDSVLETAQAVAKLREEGVDIVFEGRTQPHWKRFADELFAGLDGVTFSTASMPMDSYRRWLTNADILLLAYNFDEETKRYVQYSFANKAPELLAAGSAIIAYGPDYIDTIDYLAQRGLAQMVTKQGVAEVTEGLRALAADAAMRAELGKRGAHHAFEAFELDRQKEKMTAALQEISKRWRPPIFDFHPRARAEFDELAFAVKTVGGDERRRISYQGETALKRAAQYSDSGWDVRAAQPSSEIQGATAEGLSETALLCVDIAEPSSVDIVRAGAAAGAFDTVCALLERPTDEAEAARAHEIAKALAATGFSVFVSEWRAAESEGAPSSWKKLARYPTEPSGREIAGVVAFLNEPPAKTLDEAFSAALQYSKQYDPRTGRPSKGTQRPTGRRPAGGMRANGTEAMSIRSYIKARHPVLADLLRFAAWSARAMMRRLFGFFGLFLVLMIGLGVTAWRMPEHAILWLSIAGASLLALIGFLAIGYGKHLFNVYRREQAAAATELRLAMEAKLRDAKAAAKLEARQLAAEHEKLCGELRRGEEALAHAKKALREEQFNKISQMREKVDRIAQRQDELIGKLRADANKLMTSQSRMSVANASAARPHIRRLEEEKLDRFRGTWVKTFGLDLSKSQLAYLAHKICLMEDVAEGRLATPIETMLLRLLASHSLKGESLDILEIGTLFGVSAASLYALRAPQDRSVSLTLIDPMEGY
ncbi:MAG: hypothetical protein KDA48_16210, partial [Amphiplicatus sp.]|nr:hypothetical protein [Amphiplicatus sp.]